MGRLTLTYLAIYILRFVWFTVETFLDLMLCLVDVCYGKLSNLTLGTKIIVYSLLMGAVLMLISPFNPTMDPTFDSGPLELQPFQIFKPTEAHNEWNKIHVERNKSIDKDKKAIIHLVVKFLSDTPNEKFIEKTSNEALPVLHIREKIEDVEEELLIVEPLE